jgi:hypothetical protein
VPFIDYARGDGYVIGAGGDAEWTRILISDDTPWVDGYRGLFGLDTYDRFGGERAPAGPKYGRAGTVRQSWNDPLGFGGLDKTAPPFRQPEELRRRIDQLTASRAEVAADIEQRSAAIPGLDLETRALAANGSMEALHRARAADLAAAESELAGLRRKDAGLVDSILALREELRRVEAGDFGGPRAHLKHDHHPVPAELTRYGRAVEVWSAVSVAVLLVAVVGLIFFANTTWLVGLAVGVIGYVLIESAFRRRLTTLLLRVTLVLSLLTLALLAVQFAGILVALAIAAFALIVFADNVREVARG